MGWFDLFKSFGIFTIAAGIIAFTIRSLVVHYLSLDVEDYKQKLALIAAKEVEELKTKLQITAKEQEIRFTRLQEKRAGILSDLYLLIAEAKSSADQLYNNIHLIEQAQKIINDQSEATKEILRPVRGVPDKRLETYMESAALACTNAQSFFEKHQLYLDEDLAFQLDTLLKSIEGIAVLGDFYKLEMPVSNEFLSFTLKRWVEEKPLLLSVMKRIEKEFRIMLGSKHDLDYPQLTP